MIRDGSRSSQPVTQAPLPSGAPLLLIPNCTQELPSGPVHPGAVWCVVHMEFCTNAAKRSNQPHPSHALRLPLAGCRRRSRIFLAVTPSRICTTLQHFAPVCSDFAAGSQLEPSENQCVVLPTTWTHSRSQTVPIRFAISVQYWSSFGLVSSARLARLRQRLKPKISVKTVKKR
jgi:hypothetical protein